MDTSIRKRAVAFVRVGAILAFVAGASTPAFAQSAFWSTAATTGGSWGDSSNWQGGVVPSGSENAAAFVLDFTAGASVTLDGDRVIGSIFTSGVNPWRLDSGTSGALTVANITVTGGPLSVSTPLAGVDFAKDGSGVLSFTNPNSSYSGSININAGTLSLIGSGNYSTNSNALHLASGAILDVTQLNAGIRFGGDPSTRLAVNDGDLVNGTGTVNGGLKVKSGGTVYPGDNGVGTLTVKGAVDFAAGSNWKVKLSTANPGSSNVNNRINVNAAVKLAGGMNMPIDGSGLTFSAGQGYDYVIASGASNFDIGSVIFQPTNFNLGTLVSPANFSFVTNGGNLTLHFTPAPEPTFVLAACFGVAGSIHWLRRRKFG